MRAAFLAIGSELLGVERLDTNSLRATRLFQRYGVTLERKAVVGDQPRELVAELRFVLGRFDLVLVCGGLGPTEDDLTRECVAEACGRSMELREELVDRIRARFAAFGRPMPEVNRRQAYILEGAEVLDNPLGTAPGQVLEHLGTTCCLLPGVPREFDGLLSSWVEPWLQERIPDGVELDSAVLKVACRGESAVEERIASAYEEFGRESVTVLASPGEVRIELWARGEVVGRRRRLAEMSDRVAELLGDTLFARDASTTLEMVCGDLLRRQSATVATAESCTGGLIAQRLTGVPGSSTVFLGGFVAYHNRVKTEQVGVPESVLEEVGAVSAPVAEYLAQGARRKIGADYGIGVTGIAGPGGGTDEKPVGTVHLAIAGPRDEDLVQRRATFVGSRDMVRRMASQLALEMLRRRLLDPRNPGRIA